jgi:hypothetical protein
VVVVVSGSQCYAMRWVGGTLLYSEQQLVRLLDCETKARRAVVGTASNLKQAPQRAQAEQMRADWVWMNGCTRVPSGPLASAIYRLTPSTYISPITQSRLTTRDEWSTSCTHHQGHRPEG